MSNFIFIILAILIPFFSIALGMIVSSWQSTGVSIAATVFVLLFLSCGYHYFLTIWQAKIRAPAKAIEYSLILLSETSDLSKAQGLDIPYIFGLGILGHIACFVFIAGISMTTSKFEPISILIGKGIILAGLIWGVIRNSKASPFFVPQLIASREGIRNQKYLIPWTDIVKVYVSSNRGNPICVQTAHGVSAYRIYGDGKELAYEAKTIELLALGMWRTDAAQYLFLRAQLTCEANKLPSQQGPDFLSG